MSEAVKDDCKILEMRGTDVVSCPNKFALVDIVSRYGLYFRILDVLSTKRKGRQNMTFNKYPYLF